MQPLVVTLQQGDTREQVKGLLIPTLKERQALWTESGGGSDFKDDSLSLTEAQVVAAAKRHWPLFAQDEVGLQIVFRTADIDGGGTLDWSVSISPPSYPNPAVQSPRLISTLVVQAGVSAVLQPAVAVRQDLRRGARGR
jgi:hypothetical protein